MWSSFASGHALITEEPFGVVIHHWSDAFISQSRLLVPVRHHASVSYALVRERCEARPTTLSHWADYIVYSIFNFIIASYRQMPETI